LQEYGKIYCLSLTSAIGLALDKSEVSLLTSELGACFIKHFTIQEQFLAHKQSTSFCRTSGLLSCLLGL
jgi:hypothetical protein